MQDRTENHHEYVGAEGFFIMVVWTLSTYLVGLHNLSRSALNDAIKKSIKQSSEDVQQLRFAGVWSGCAVWRLGLLLHAGVVGGAEAS